MEAIAVAHPIAIIAVDGGEMNEKIDQGKIEVPKKNRIQVSNTKKPLFFYLNLAKRLIKQHNDIVLSALGMAIPTVVTIAEILKANGLALEKQVLTSTIGTKDETKGRIVQKPKIEIVLGKTEKAENLKANGGLSPKNAENPKDNAGTAPKNAENPKDNAGSAPKNTENLKDNFGTAPKNAENQDNSAKASKNAENRKDNADLASRNAENRKNNAGTALKNTENQKANAGLALKNAANLKANAGTAPMSAASKTE